MKKYPSLSPYNFCANSPIFMLDENGKDIIVYGISQLSGKMVPIIHIVTDDENDVEICTSILAPSHYVEFPIPDKPTVIDMTKSTVYQVANKLFTNENIRQLETSEKKVEAVFLELGADAVLGLGTSGNIQIVKFRNNETHVFYNIVNPSSKDDGQYGLDIGVGFKIGVGVFNYKNGKFDKPSAESFAYGESFFANVGTPIVSMSYGANFNNGYCSIANYKASTIWETMAVGSAEFMEIGIPDIEFGASTGCSQGDMVEQNCKPEDFENPNYLEDFKANRRQKQIFENLDRELYKE